LVKSLARLAALAAVAVAGLLSACEMKSAPQKVRTLCAEGGSVAHFAPGTFEKEHRHDDLKRGWYSNHLSAMAEPSLQCVTAHPVYRFLWLRTFHRPISVRVEQRNDGIYLFAVELDGAGGYEPGEESKRIEHKLSVSQAHVFIDALTKARVWEPVGKKDRFGFDGARWIIEARDGDRYLIHDEWSPDNGRIRDLGLVFVKLTGWDIHPKELY
jgi:hypothetical protein